jgi:hypothetical protein
MLRAIHGVPSHERYSGIMCSWVRRAFKAPYEGFRIQRHIAPLTTVGKAHGRITMDLSNHRPLNSTLSSNPRSIPSTTSSRVVENVK